MATAFSWLARDHEIVALTPLKDAFEEAAASDPRARLHWPDVDARAFERHRGQLLLEVGYGTAGGEELSGFVSIRQPEGADDRFRVIISTSFGDTKVLLKELFELADAAAGKLGLTEGLGHAVGDRADEDEPDKDEDEHEHEHDTALHHAEHDHHTEHHHHVDAHEDEEDDEHDADLPGPKQLAAWLDPEHLIHSVEEDAVTLLAGSGEWEVTVVVDDDMLSFFSSPDEIQDLDPREALRMSYRLDWGHLELDDETGEDDLLLFVGMTPRHGKDRHDFLSEFGLYVDDLEALVAHARATRLDEDDEGDEGDEGESDDDEGDD
ncbi:hypothetical protein [Chondromyces apiculatus]|uniref:Uncharacterized protein n=1 Tax=Chondromyces apiculatus DSM 436 TaxID=1192034 RepID=A0A017T7Y9_9BACT|nr:hypothetical protein [Chondromyces apiculatus]EYF05052.1 Hypothetical protein CAP_3642 [Chondromyces apiculatus DSM 436]